MLFALPLWFGCSNEADEPNTGSVPVIEMYEGDPIPVSISVGSINSGIQTRSGAEKLVFSQPLDKNFDTGYDVVTTIEQMPEMETRATTSVLADAKYRLLAYRGDAISSANFAGQGDYETKTDGKGTAIGTQLYLPKGTYTFVCYTFGNNNDIPAFNGENTLITVAQGDDFMTCIQKNVTVEDKGDGEFTLDNDFTRQCSQITLEVSATGFPDNEIKACAAKMNNINDNTVIWDFSTSALLPNTGTSGNADFSWTTLNDTLVTSEPQIILPIKARDLSILMTSLTIGAEVLDSTRTSFGYSNVEFIPGGKYKVNISIERNYIPVGGYKWAKGNVYKSADGNFSFEATQGGYHPEMYDGSYFEWNTLDTGLKSANAGDYTYATDPCSKVFPEGTWQTPSRTESVALAKDYEWDATAKGIWFGTAPNRVFLPAIGMRAYNGNSKPILDNDGTFVLYSLRDYSPRYNQALSIDKDGVYWLSTLLRYNGLPIRCVKK